jgi:hypothetical protein
MRKLHCGAPIDLAPAQAAISEERFPRSMNSNNPLAVEPENENDALLNKIVLSPVLEFHFDCSGGSSDSDKDFLK